MGQRVILVAVSVKGDTMEEAQRNLMAVLPEPDGDTIEEWWIAEDERYDGSDNDSAKFVPGYAERQFERLSSAT